MGSPADNKPLKVGLLFLGRRRPGFDMEWGRRMEDRVRRGMDQTGFSLFEPPEKAIDDESLGRAIAACRKEEVDVLVFLQTTMADGRLAPTVAQLWPDPPVLWATPENQEGDMISSCSLVGAHAWASTLRQMGHAFELVYGDPDDAAVLKRLVETVRLAATVRRLRAARIGVVGGHAPGFFAMGADSFGQHRGLGVQVQYYSLVEFSNLVADFSDAEVAADVAKVQALGLDHKDTTDDDLPTASRLYLAMRRYFESERLDALAVRCWPEMPNTLGQWPYLGMGRLAEEGRAVACEGDADGALSAWIGERLGMGRCYLSDWLEHDAHAITLWHGGAAPMSLSPPRGEPGAPRIARHFNSKKPAVLEATIRADMPVTIFRLWRLDGAYRLSAREGRTLRPRRPLMGTNALARLADEDPRAWFEELCHQGMPHHVAVFEGHHVALLHRLARVLHVETV